MQIATTTCLHKVGNTTVAQPVTFNAMDGYNNVVYPNTAPGGFSISYPSNYRYECTTTVDDYIAILYVPVFLILITLIIMITLKIFEFRNPWKA